MKVLLAVNPHKPKALELASSIEAVLRSRMDMEVRRCEVPFESSGFGNSAGPVNAGESSLLEGLDLVFSLGGDGTVLYVARLVSPRNIPIIPVNLGTFGFIAGVHPPEWEPVFLQHLEGKAELSRRLMLSIRVERGDSMVFRGACLNDAVISASGIAKIIKLNLFSESEELELGNYLSDGLILATPTGSTAYSVAAGGPILDPELEALIVNPICPFTLSNRPLVLPAAETLIVKLEQEQRSGVLLTVDGQETAKLLPGDCIHIRKAPYTADLIASGREAFYRALKSKLNWAGGPAQGSQGEKLYRDPDESKFPSGETHD
ncbi:MAG: NAD(+)/NADH kinase [Treponema sp.]|jgi:NAD+ kinase|nr:NAD(+)/NADH kinase [Treponema sp.]